MKTIYPMKALCLMAMLGWAAAVNAQENATKDKNLNREMTLEREYDPSVQDASKVNTLPEVKEPEVRKIPIDYATYMIAVEPEKEITLLPAGNVMTQMAYNKRRGYLNAGAGTRLNINGDFGYHLLSTETDQLNIWFSHRSTNGNVKYIQLEDVKVKAKINDNLGGLNFRHVFDQAIFKLDIQYGYSAYNYYGMPVDALSDSDETLLETADRDTKQGDQTIAARIGVESREEATVGYSLDVGYTNFSHKYGLSVGEDGPTEHTFTARIDVNTLLSGEARLGIGGQINYFNYSLPTEKAASSYTYAPEDHAEITLSPYYKGAGNHWNLRLGANVMIITGDESKFAASPNVMADVEIAERTQLYLNAGGGLSANSMYEISRINRYTNPTERIAPSRNWLDATLGIRSGVAPGFWLDVFGGYKITSGDVLFLPSTTFTEGHFGNVSEAMSDIDTKQFFVGAQFKYSYQPLLDISLKGVYHHWKANLGDSWMIEEPNDELDHAWGKPEVEVNVGLTIRPVERLAILLDYYLATGRYTQLEGVGEYKMDNIHELNITGTYTINDAFGVYAKVSNVLSQKYEVYYGYPMQRFGVMVGVNINF